jgi:hypothetical protein
MAPWMTVFMDVLLTYQDTYINKRGNEKGRVKILKDCHNAILEKIEAHASVVLPDGLQLVSSTILSCLSYLNDLVPSPGNQKGVPLGTPQ